MRAPHPVSASLLLLAGCWVTPGEIDGKLGVPVGTTVGAGTPGGAPGATTTGTPGLACVDEPLGSAVGNGVASGTTGGQGDDLVPECFGAVPGTGADRALSWTAPNSACFSFRVADAGFDSVLYLREGDCDGAEVACNDDRSPVDASSEIGLQATGGTTYVVVVDGHDAGDNGAWSLDINPVNAIPVDLDLGDAPGTWGGGNVGSDDTLSPGNCPLGSGADVLVRWTAPSDALWTFRITQGGPTNFDTVLTLYRPCTEEAIACDDQWSLAYPNGGESLQLQLYAGEPVIVRIAGFRSPYESPDQGQFQLVIE